MIVTTRIRVDLTRPNFGSPVDAVQGDGNTRCIEVTLLQNGIPWNPPAGAGIAVVYTKPDRTKGLYDKLADGTPAVTVNGSTVTVTLAPQMLTVPGIVNAGIVFNSAQLDQLTTFPFPVRVEKNPFAGAQESQDYIRLQWLEDKLRAYIEHIGGMDETAVRRIMAEYLAENPPLTVQLTFGADFEGKTYTITGGANETYTGTVPADLTVTRTVKTLNAEYVVTSTNADGIPYERTVTVGSYYGVYRGRFESFRAYLACTADPGSTVTATNGTKTYSCTADSEGKVTLNIYATGTYSVTCSMDGATSDAVIVEITEGGATYTCKLPSLFGPEIVSWADGTDEQIAAMVAALDDGTISIETTGWSIGDERQVTLSAMPATFVNESHVEQTVTLVLMDSQHYTLTNPTAGGDTKDHFVVGLKNLLANGTNRESGYMNQSETNRGSWSGCARRAWCNDVFRAAIPETLRGCFKQFKVPTATTYNGSSVTETDDYFALFAEKEIFGSCTFSNTTEANALSQIKWYETAANRIKKSGGDAGDAHSWWERSPRSSIGNSFLIVYPDGTANTNIAAFDADIAPFGCI